MQAAIAALHAARRRREDTDWAQIDLLYGALERLRPSPVVTLNRAVAVSKVRGPEAALDMIEPLAPKLAGYFHFFGVRGALLMQLGRERRGARRLRPRDRARQHRRAKRAHIRMHIDRLIQGGQPKAEGEGEEGTRRSPRRSDVKKSSARCRPRPSCSSYGQIQGSRSLRVVAIVAIVLAVSIAAVLAFALTKPDTAFGVERRSRVRAKAERDLSAG